MNKINCSTLAGFHERLLATGFESRFSITVDEPYVGSQTRVTVCCAKHGEYETTAGGLVKTKHGCPGCASESKRKLATGRVLGNYKTTEDEFWSYIRERGFDTRFEVVLEPYRGALTKVTLTCPDHGLHLTIAGDVMRSKYGCPKCGQLASGASTAKRMKGVPLKSKWKPVEEFIEQVSLPKEITLDISNYESLSYGSVTTSCDRHGENVWAPPSTLLTSKYGCRECAQLARNEAKENTWSDFLARARDRFGDRFQYVNQHSYTNLRSLVEIVCIEHGSQSIRASKHVIAGQYCAECRMEDLRASGKLVGYVGDAIERDPSFGETPARLYYVRIGKLYKIGISWAADPKSRFRALRRESGKEVEVIEVVECSLLEAYTWEQQILAEFAEHRVTRSWSTELFDYDVLASHFGLNAWLNSQPATKLLLNMGNNSVTDRNTERRNYE